MNNKIAWFFIIFVLLGSCLGIAGFCIGVANADFDNSTLFAWYPLNDFSIVTKFDTTDYYNNYVVYTQGESSSDEYGRVAVWNEGLAYTLYAETFNTPSRFAQTFNFTLDQSYDYIEFQYSWLPSPANGFYLRLEANGYKAVISDSGLSFDQVSLAVSSFPNGNPSYYLDIYLMLGDVPASGDLSQSTSWKVTYLNNGMNIANIAVMDPDFVSTYFETLPDLNYESIYDMAYDQGYSDGKTYGYSQGVNSANKFTFMSLIDALFFAPLKFLSSLLNFDFFGVNLLGLFTGLITIVVIVTIVRIFI